MNKDKEVKIGDRVVHPKGTLLTLNAQEAVEKINGKSLLADGIADSIVDLIQKAGLKGNVVSLGPTGFEQLAFWITALAPLLLLGGIIGAAIVIALLARYLPKTSIYRRFALESANPPGPSLTGAPREFATRMELSPGAEGVSLSILRPSGKAKFLDQIVDVVTQGEFIP